VHERGATWSRSRVKFFASFLFSENMQQKSGFAIAFDFFLNMSNLAAT